MKNYRDDFKVRFTNKPQYTIDEENKTVKCYLTCDVIVPTGISGNQFMYNFRTFAKGYAKCDDKDAFNPEIGKKIALARAESKIYWKVRTEVKNAVRDAKQFVKAGNKFILKACRVVDHNNDYISNYVNPSREFEIDVDEDLIRKVFSAKAKAQPRDEQGRFTACTDSNKYKFYDKNRDASNKGHYDNRKTHAKPGSIKITINRK